MKQRKNITKAILFAGLLTINSTANSFYQCVPKSDYIKNKAKEEITDAYIQNEAKKVIRDKKWVEEIIKEKEDGKWKYVHDVNVIDKEDGHFISKKIDLGYGVYKFVMNFIENNDTQPCNNYGDTTIPYVLVKESVFIMQSKSGGDMGGLYIDDDFVNQKEPIKNFCLPTNVKIYKKVK